MVSLKDWSPVAKVYEPLKAGSIDGTDTEAHDHAIIRALEAKYRPNKQLDSDRDLTLFVGRLSPKTAEADLEELFKKYGTIKSLKLIRDVVTGFSKRYAFVEYEEEDALFKAMRETNKMILHHCEILVDYECGRTLSGWVPRRLGGGFGGKKESGQLRFGGRDRPFKKPFIFEAAENKTAGDGYKNRQDRSYEQRRPNERDDSFSRNKHRHERSDRYRKRSRSRSRGRDRNKSNRHDYDYESRSRYKSRSRSRSRDRDRSRSRGRSRSRDRSRSYRKDSDYRRRRSYSRDRDDY